MTPDLDPDLESAARRALHRLAESIDTDADVEADADESSTPRRRQLVARPAMRVALAAATTIVALSAATILVLVRNGDDDEGRVTVSDERGGATATSVPPASEDVPGELAQWLAGTWVNANGDPVPEQGRGPTMRIYQGPEHCSWQQMTFVNLSWPPGFASTTQDLYRTFVRDPAGVIVEQRLQVKVHGLFDSKVQPPDDAAATGLHNGEAEIWIAHSNDQAIYVRRPDGSFELWPRAEDTFMCL